MDKTVQIKIEPVDIKVETMDDVKDDKLCKEIPSRIPLWISNHTDCLTIQNDTEVYCRVCEKVIVCYKKTHIVQHVNAKVHLNRLHIHSEEEDTFNTDLYETFVAANIPIHKLSNPVLRLFLAKYTQRYIPTESALRKKCLSNSYWKMMHKIKEKASNNYIWVSADQTVDIKGRSIVNILIGILSSTETHKPYLIASKIIDTVSDNYMSTLIQEALDSLFSNIPEDRNKILLFVSDSDPCLVKTGKLLKNIYPNMLHITCIAHTLHKIAEFIRAQYKNVNKLISLFKKQILTPSGVDRYKQLYPSLPLPPVVITTQWGTWLNAAFFYAENFFAIKSGIQSLDENAKSIRDCKQLLENPDLFEDLSFIAHNFMNIPIAIKELETQNILLEKSLEVLNSTLSTLNSTSCRFSERLNHKIDDVINRNSDVGILQQICNNNFNNPHIQCKYSELIEYFKFAPITSYDVEITLSLFKEIFTSKRTRFTDDNLEKIVVLAVNSQIKLDTFNR